MKNSEPKKIQFAIAWDWEFDYDLVRFLKSAAHEHQISFLDITVYDLETVLSDLKNGSLEIQWLLDRASDANPMFLPLQSLSEKHHINVINPYSASFRTMDKAVMHYELIRHGVHVPHTIMLPAYDEMKIVDDGLMKEILKLKLPFVLKPANGGGGDGVIKNVTSPYHVHDGRKPHHWDKYLAQEKIYPKYLYGWRSWFRAYYIFGEVELVWWDDSKYTYRAVSESDSATLNISKVVEIMNRIAEATKSDSGGMDFFSSELVITKENNWVAVDYVNDQIDLRPKSRHFDGVPDDVIKRIIEKIMLHVKSFNRASDSIKS